MTKILKYLFLIGIVTGGLLAFGGRAKAADVASETALWIGTEAYQFAGAPYGGNVNDTNGWRVERGMRIWVHAHAKNAGDQIWYAGSNYVLEVCSPAWGGNDPNNPNWCPDYQVASVVLTTTVNPGQYLDQPFWIYAPTQTGNYRLYVTLSKYGYYQIGRLATVPINTISGGPNAAFVSQSINGVARSQGETITLLAGQSYNYSITWNNNGTQTWDNARVRQNELAPSGGGYWDYRFKLGTKDNLLSEIIPPVRLEFSEVVTPGQSKTFSTTITPTIRGTYNFQVRMLQEHVNWFGPDSPLLILRVVQKPTCTGVAPGPGTITVRPNGTWLLTINGVSADVTGLGAATWSDANGQDDIIWYPGTKINANTWQSSLGLSSASLYSLGSVSVHVYLLNPDYPTYAGDGFCGATSFELRDDGWVTVTIDPGITWTLTAPIGWSPATYSGSGTQTLTGVPYGTWRITPADRPGYAIDTILPSNPQELRLP
ncbi:MAG: GBS Bsp-like repeat-containing protein [Acidobacteriaceae bacterium]